MEGKLHAAAARLADGWQPHTPSTVTLEGLLLREIRGVFAVVVLSGPTRQQQAAQGNEGVASSRI